MVKTTAPHLMISYREPISKISHLSEQVLQKVAYSLLVGFSPGDVIPCGVVLQLIHSG